MVNTIRYHRSMETIKKHWWQILLMSGGLVMMVVGIVLAQRETKGESLLIVEPSILPSPALTLLVIDVEGAVEKPGIYQLPSGSRVGEGIVAAGGLSIQADRSYVARFINQAELVRDGMKLYIPEKGEQIDISDPLRGTGNLQATSLNGAISINSASEAELDTLWGVGAARAKTIIDNRPYVSLEELVTKAKLTQDVIDKNQGKIGL